MRRRTGTRTFCFMVVAFLTLLFLLAGGESLAFFWKDTNYEAGVKYFKNKDYDLAKQSLLSALKDDPNDTKARQILGFVYFKLNRLKEAENIFLALYNKKKDDPNALQGLAWVNFNLGRDDEAKKFFREEIKWANDHLNNEIYTYYELKDKGYIESVYSDGRFGLALIAKRSKQFDEALRELKQAMKYNNEFTGEDVFLSHQGDIYFNQSKFDEAAKAYEKAAKEDKTNASYPVNAGLSYYAKKDYAAAEEAFEKALKIDDVNAGAAYGLFLARYEKGDYDRAKQSLVRMIAINPYYPDNVTVHNMIAKQSGWSDLWKNFGIAFYRFGHYSRAVFMLDSYLAYVKADDVESLSAAGWCYRFLGVKETATKYFQKAAELAPMSEDAIVGLASLQLEAGNTAEAKKMIDHALKLNPKSIAANNLLAYLYLYQKEDANALDTLKRAIAQNEKDTILAGTLAGIYFNQKMYAEAAREYEKIVRIEKKSVSSWNNLGWCRYHGGQYADAVRAFAESRKIYPNQAEPYYGMALVYVKMNDLEQARVELATSLQLKPDYIYSQELAALMKANKDWKDLHLVAAAGYFYQQQIKTALDLYQNHLKEDADDIKANLGAGWSLFYLGQGDAAFPHFQRVLKIEPENVDALTGSGWVLANKGKEKEALSYIERALAMKPDSSNALRVKAAIHYRQKEFREADALYKKLAGFEPYAADIYTNRARALLKEGKYDSAIDNFNIGATLNPYAGDPFYGLALCYAGKGDYAKAKSFFYTAISLNPAFMDGQELYDLIGKSKELGDLYNALGQSYLNRYNYDKAKFHFQQMLRRDNGNEDAALGIAAVSYSLGKFKEAAVQYANILKKAPSSSEGWDKWSMAMENLGWSYFNMKEYEQALAAFQRLSGYNAKASFIAPLNGMGWCELKKNNKTAAEGYFRQSLALVPGNYSATTGMAALKQNP